jgi:hypothetical protein
MTVINTREPQDTLGEDEQVIAELTDGMKLIKTPDGGIVRPAKDSGMMEQEFESWDNATLFFGLWIETGGWSDAYPTSGDRQIPIEVVSAGKDAVAAYIRVGTGAVGTAGRAASLLDVTEQTVYNYCNRVRFSPE